MLSTFSWLAQSLRRPVLELVVLETSATSTGRRRTVASRDVMVEDANDGDKDGSLAVSLVEVDEQASD